MPRVYAQRGCELWSVQLQRPFEFESPFGATEYSLWLHVVDPSVTKEERLALSAAIAGTSCRYVVSSGEDASLWQDVIDESYLAGKPDGQPGDEGFLMTAEENSLANAAFFFARSTSFDDYTARRLFLVVVGGDTAARDAAADAALVVLRDDD